MSEGAPAARPAGEATPPYVRSRELPDPKPVPSSDSIKKEVSPFDDADWRMRWYNYLGFLLRVLLIGGGVAAAGGVVFTAMEYFAARDEKRVERTLELVTLWEGDKYQDAQKALAERISTLEDFAAKELGNNPSKEKIQIISMSIRQAVMTEKGGKMPIEKFQEHFDRIVYFLNRLSFCVQGNICSREVADAYFLDFAKSFWDYFGVYIHQQRREGSRTYAQPIEDYVKASGSSDAPLAVPATPSDPAPAG